MSRPRKKQTTTDSTTNKELSIRQQLLQEIRITLKCKNETQKKLLKSIENNDVTICSGLAGTGKTLLTVYKTLLLLKNNSSTYHEIKLVKSIIQLRDEELGILPGDEKDKMKFHMMSFIDAFHKLIGKDLTNRLIEHGLIKMEVFGAIRGRSFSNALIIIDEFQNISKDNAKTFLTRFSDNTKVIVLGDSGQIDIKKKENSALEPLVKQVEKNPVEGVEVIRFKDDEVVRHRLTSYFVKVFENINNDQTNPKLIKEGKLIRVEPRMVNVVSQINWLNKVKKFFNF